MNTAKPFARKFNDMLYQDSSSFSDEVRAFSLVEMLVVMAIIALLFGLGIPALSSMRTASGFSKDVQQLADTLAFARSHALAKGRTVDVGLQNVESGIVLVVGERDAIGFHPIARTRVLSGVRVEEFTPTSGLPSIVDAQNGSFSQVIRFNNRGEARVRTDGIDRQVDIQILPNVAGETPQALRSNRVDILIHGLSGGVSLVRDGRKQSP